VNAVGRLALASSSKVVVDNLAQSKTLARMALDSLFMFQNPDHVEGRNGRVPTNPVVKQNLTAKALRVVFDIAPTTNRLGVPENARGDRNSHWNCKGFP
jgi:hypothetical protein